MTYIYACIFVLAVPLLVAGAAYSSTKYQNSQRRKLKNKSDDKEKNSTDKMMVKEWLHQVSFMPVVFIQ